MGENMFQLLNLRSGRFYDGNNLCTFIYFTAQEDDNVCMYVPMCKRLPIEC